MSIQLVAQNSEIVWLGDAWICSKEVKHYPALCRNETNVPVYYTVWIMAADNKSLSVKRLMCHTQVKVNNVSAFSLSKQHGYSSQPVLSALKSHVPGSSNANGKIELPSQDSSMRGCRFRCKILRSMAKLLRGQYHDIQDVDGTKKIEVQIDFDDTTSFEHVFKVYWVFFEENLSLTLNDLMQAKNPWKGVTTLARSRSSVEFSYFSTKHLEFMNKLHRE